MTLCGDLVYLVLTIKVRLDLLDYQHKVLVLYEECLKICILVWPIFNL